MSHTAYIHGTTPSEQERLVLLNRLTNPAFQSFIALTDRSNVLEVGSGMGLFAQELAEKYPSNHIHTIEISMTQIKKDSHTSSNRFALQGDAHYLPYKNAAFDVIFCRYLLEHVRQPELVLTEIKRLLKPGGKFYIQENNISVHIFEPECPYFEEIWKKFVLLQKQLGGDALIGKRLFALLRQAGFRSIKLSIQPEVHAAGSATFADWIRNIIGNIHSCEEQLVKKRLVERETIQRAYQELINLLKNEDAAAYFYWNRAIAEK